MTNPFESGERKIVPAVLVYGFCGDQLLMVHRVPRAKPGQDYHEGKWNGLGGKLDSDESPLQAARREFREECGLDLAEEAFHALGVLQFPHFKRAKNEDWIVWVYWAEVTQAQSLQLGPCPEGDLHWVKKSELMNRPLWAGDVYFLPLVLEKRKFLGTIWYEGEKVLKHSITLL